MKKFLLAVAALAWLQASSAWADTVATGDGLTVQDWFRHGAPLDLRAELAVARAQGKRLAVLWLAPADADSEKLVTENYAHPKVAAYAHDHYRIVALNAFGTAPVTLPDGTASTEGELAIQRGLVRLPTTEFYESDGTAFFQLDGYISPRFYFAGLMFVGSGEYAGPQYRGMFVRWSRANSARVGELFAAE